ncbi:hypothetical protein E6C67_03045 (plasmid) [Azospirillum sp. TSA2s]|uniref:hypothetical protein n=1 Tax=Azospirillum sp. TSA2s TaxID=709810 RepID=UPI0010A9A051|nr:hypothetical protein [Azospirillum sp. TSA2s]QCG92942.1 hypothetical protein E6C67_03045 [Azospirillum sp. TSA2s]
MLAVLRAGRQGLVRLFLDEDPELYTDILRSRPNQILTEILIQRHILCWQSGHFSLADDVASQVGLTPEDREGLTCRLATCVAEMTEDGRRAASAQEAASLISSVLLERQGTLESLIDYEARSARNLNRVRYLAEKERAAMAVLIQSLVATHRE